MVTALDERESDNTMVCWLTNPSILNLFVFMIIYILFTYIGSLRKNGKETTELRVLTGDWQGPIQVAKIQYQIDQNSGNSSVFLDVPAGDMTG